MTGATIRIDSSELGAVGRRLEHLAACVDDMTPVMDEIGSMLVASTQDRFEHGRDPAGQDWLPSIRVQEAQGAAQTLVLGNYLKDSITHDPGRDSVAVGSSMVYAAIHQFGGPAGRGRKTTIPARPYLGVSPEDEREIGNIIDDYLMEAFR